MTLKDLACVTRRMESLYASTSRGLSAGSSLGKPVSSNMPIQYVALLSSMQLPESMMLLLALKFCTHHFLPTNRVPSTPATTPSSDLREQIREL